MPKLSATPRPAAPELLAAAPLAALDPKAPPEAAEFVLAEALVGVTAAPPVCVPTEGWK